MMETEEIVTSQTLTSCPVVVDISIMHVGRVAEIVVRNDMRRHL